MVLKVLTPGRLSEVTNSPPILGKVNVILFTSMVRPACNIFNGADVEITQPALLNVICALLLSLAVMLAALMTVIFAIVFEH